MIPRFSQRLNIEPDDNVIIGAYRIMKYLNINSLVTLYRWIEMGLPCIKRPDGAWMTTMTAIDQWIFLVHDIGTDERALRTAKKAEEGIYGAHAPNPNQLKYVDFQEKYGDAYNGNKGRNRRIGPPSSDDIPTEIRPRAFGPDQKPEPE